MKRFWSKVSLDLPTECWEWSAYRHRGYGIFALSFGRNVRAHVYAYQQLVGPIPKGLELDHLCRNKPCVNPLHLQPVTHAVNVSRGDAGAYLAARTHCPKGHAYDEKNTFVCAGRRRCRRCAREKRRAERGCKKPRVLP